LLAAGGGASTLCFSPPMSTLPPDLVRMKSASAAKAMKATMIFQMLVSSGLVAGHDGVASA
jgi:hypothetical protein